MKEVTEVIEEQQQIEVDSLRFKKIPVEQLLHIRLMHTNFLLKESYEELGVVKNMLTQAQNALKDIKEENRKLREAK